jgi:hypothetical protein
MANRSGTALVWGVHAEIHTSTRTGEPIRIGCSCVLGEDHTFGDFLAAYGNPGGRGLQADPQRARSARGAKNEVPA